MLKMNHSSCYCFSFFYDHQTFEYQYTVIASLEKIGSLTNNVSSSKNSIKSFNDSSLCWLLRSISVFVFQLSAIPSGKFETNMQRVPQRVSGVSLAFYFVAAPRLLHLFKKAKNSRCDFPSPYFIGGQFFISFR